MLIGAVLVFAMSGVYMIVDQIAILFAIRLIHGAAYGLLATALGTVVTETVPESKRGEGIGYYMSVSYTHLDVYKRQRYL